MIGLLLVGLLCWPALGWAGEAKSTYGLVNDWGATIVQANESDRRGQYWSWRHGSIDGQFGVLIAGSDQEQLGYAILSALRSTLQGARFAIDQEYIPSQPDCLATMEKAMKAADNFSPRYVNHITLDIELRCKRLLGAQACKAREDELKRQIDDFDKLWADAKKCWRTP